MKTIYYPILILLLFCMQGTLNAQKISITDVVFSEYRGHGPIINQNEVQGYYLFYKLNKVDRKTNTYLLKILDNNLNEVSKKTMTDDKHIYLHEVTYNGSSIMLKFYNSKETSLVFKRYDRNAEFKAKKTIVMDKKRDLQLYLGPNQNPGDYGANDLFAIEKKGFVHYMKHKNKKPGYSVTFFPETEGGKKWSIESNRESKELEEATFLATNGEILVNTISKRPSMMSKDFKSYIQGVDIATGKKLFETLLEDKKYALSLMSGTFDKKSGEIILLGEYYNLGDKIGKSQSQGLFSRKIDADGKTLATNHQSWKKDITKFLDVDQKGRIADVGYIYFHKIVQTKTGKTFAIGESYKKVASGMGIAATALGGQASLVDISIRDMFIFEFDADFVISDVHVFDKTKSTFALPQGGGLASAQLLARYIDYYNGFDYAFTQSKNDNSSLTIGYLDFERKKGEKNMVRFTALSYVDGEFVKDKIDMETKNTKLWIEPAKHGHVLLYEYNRKEKKLEMRLEKINF